MKQADKLPKSDNIKSLNEEAEVSLKALTQRILVDPVMTPINKIYELQEKLRVEVESLQGESTLIRDLLTTLEEKVDAGYKSQKSLQDEVRNIASALSDLRGMAHQDNEKILASSQEGLQMLRNAIPSLAGGLESHGETLDHLENQLVAIESVSQNTYDSLKHEVETLTKATSVLREEVLHDIEKILISNREGHQSLKEAVPSLSGTMDSHGKALGRLETRQEAIESASEEWHQRVGNDVTSLGTTVTARIEELKGVFEHLQELHGSQRKELQEFMAMKNFPLPLESTSSLTTTQFLEGRIRFWRGTAILFGVLGMGMAMYLITRFVHR